jgi:ABC-2 type transport system permease protein
VRALVELARIELKLYLREPVAVFFTLVFPLIPLLLSGLLFGAQEAMPGFRVIDVYVPALIAMVVAYSGLMGIPIALSEYREQGVLKRFRASPLRLSTVLFAHVAVQVGALLASAAVIVAVAQLAFGLRFAVRPAPLLLVGALGCAALFTLGFAVVGLCSGPRNTQAVGSVLFFAMLFTSGAAIPRRQFPPWLQRATDWVPLSHLVDALTDVWVGEPLGGSGVELAVLAGLAGVSFAVARRTFRWE